MIRTVLGDIKKEELGVTSAHEHVLSDIRTLVDPIDHEDFYAPLTVDKRYLVNEDPYNMMDNAVIDTEATIKDLKIFKKWGGDAIVEVSTDELKRDAKEIKRVSIESGVKIVMGTGRYLGASISKESLNKSVETLAQEIIDDVTKGAQGTDIKAGVIGEIGTSHDVSEDEWKSVRAAAIAGAELGAGIQFHTALWARNASAIIKEVTSFGVKPEKICINHIDVDLRMDYLYEILDQGAYIEFDNIGKEFYVPKENQGLLHGRFAYDLERATVVAELVKKGYVDKILLANDIGLKSMLIAYGGNGYVHLLRHFKPMVKDMGVSEKDINKMLVDNPANFLDIENL